MTKVEMNIESIKVSLMNYQRTLILKEKEGKRTLVMFISSDGADAIKLGLEKNQVSPHQTHDFICDVITKLGATLKYVVLDNLVQETFFAKAVVEKENETIEIDCRPSDAFAIALKTGVPIYVTEEILTKASIIIDDNKSNT